MANIKKNFNFRNGVQVDDDNLLVTSTGLVGIGTTVPTESLDVRGNVKIIGDATITNATVGVLTITNVVPTQVIGAGVSIVSGIVTAQGSGIVTFYGDARYLQGMPTSQWEDTNAGFGVSSIYNTGGTVGIATTNPKSTIQIGNNVDGGESGVGISSAGNINASGIITATTFSGNVTGNVTGNLIGVAASTTQLQTARTIGGVSFDGTSNIDLPGVNIAGNQNTSGSAASLSGTPNLSVGIINASGISTFSNYVAFNPPIGSQVDFFGGLPQQRMRFRNNGSNSALHLNTYVNLWFGDSQTTHLEAHGTGNARHFRIKNYQQFSEGGSTYNTASGLTNTFQVHSDFTTFQGSPTSGHESRTISEFNYSDGASLFHFGNKKLQTSGVGVTITSQLDTTNIVASGVITATTELNSPLIGVGTDAPANDIQVRKSSDAEIQVTSDTGTAGITVGRETGASNTNNAEFRFGEVSGGAPYSSAQSLDIINYSTGNFNYHLSAANPSGVKGDYHWHKGLNSRLMTLTGIGGSLGIGVTTPSTKLEVAGGAKFAGSVEITNNLTLSGTLNANLNGNVTGRVTGNLTGNVFGYIDTPVTGISTINHLRVGQGLGIGVTDSGNKFNLGSTLDNRIFINNNSQIGIKTDTISDPNVVVEIIGNVRLKKAVSVGNTTRSAVDFSDVVNITNEGETGLPFNRSQLAYMIPPRVTTAQRNLLRDAYTNSATLLSGAMIYNTNLNKLQVWNGSAWETVTSS